jgi:hypothetical protein
MYINFVNDRKSLGYECLIDTQCGNRLVLITDSSVVFVKNVTLNGKRKAKRLFVHGMFLFQLGQPLVPCAAAVILPLPPAIERLSPFEQDRILGNKNSYPQIASIVESKTDKMVLTDQQIEDLNLICYKLQNGSMTLDKAILKLRAGGFFDWATLAFIIYMFSLEQGNSFQNVPLPHQDPFGWWSGKYDSKNVGTSPSRPTTCLEMEKPASMTQQEYSSMTKSKRRQLPDPRGRDRFINVDGSPRLDLRFNQVEFKTPSHGKDHGLPVGINNKTPKTEANAIALRDSLLDMPNRENIVWYTDGQYQGGTDRGCDSVNLFDPDTNVIAVYEKKPDGSNLFLTTCTLTDIEIDHLKSTNGNFVTEKVLEQQNWVSTFESDGMGITPISPMDENSSPNPGFTATNSFESDVMGITPIDTSQSNNP